MLEQKILIKIDMRYNKVIFRLFIIIINILLYFVIFHLIIVKKKKQENKFTQSTI